MQHQDAALRRNPPGSKTLNRQLNKLGPQPRGDRDADPGVTQRLATGLSAKELVRRQAGPWRPRLVGYSPRSLTPTPPRIGEAAAALVVSCRGPEADRAPSWLEDTSTLAFEASDEVHGS